MGDLIRSDTVLGTPTNIAGSKDKDFVIQTKGKVKIQSGNSFLDILIDGKLNMPSIINIVSTLDKIPKKTGFYYTKDTERLYAIIDKKQISLVGRDSINTTSKATRLDELEDVSLINLKNGDILVEKGGYWVNTHLSLEDITDKLKNQISNLSESVEKQKLYTQRSFKDVMQTFRMMFDPEGSYFTDKITPLAIHTAQLIVGTNSQQFNLENIKFEPNYQGDCNRFVANCIDRTKTGKLIHHTIGLENGDGSRTWDILQPATLPPDFDQPNLSSDKAYYLYAVCSRTGTTGNLLISDQQILVESDSDNYTFWIAVINTPEASMIAGDGVSTATATASLIRSFQTMFGYTEIAGNSITTGVIKDQTGFSYWDMINGALRLGGVNSYIYYNSTDGNFYLKGRLIQIDPDLNTSLNYFGNFIPSPTQLYSKGFIVTYQGSAYINVVPCYGNILPTNTDYWDVYAKGGMTTVSIYYTSATEPDTPIEQIIPPTGWSTTPTDHTSTTYTWMSQGQTFDNTNIVSTWSTPIKLTGNDGLSITISSTSITYQVSSSGTVAPTGTWTTTIPTVDIGYYLWTKTVVTYSDNTSTTAYSVSKAGSDGADATTYYMVVSPTSLTVISGALSSSTIDAFVYKKVGNNSPTLTSECSVTNNTGASVSSPSTGHYTFTVPTSYIYQSGLTVSLIYDSKYIQQVTVPITYAVGAAITFRGTIVSGTYYGSKVRKDVVKSGSAYYIAKDRSSSSNTEGSFTSSSVSDGNWQGFGSSFVSIATDLLFANNATIGGWNFNNNIMWSTDNNVYFNGGTSGLSLSSYPIMAASSSGVITAPTSADNPGTLKTITQLKTLSSVFYVDHNGSIYSTSGQIGGFTINTNSIESSYDYGSNSQFYLHSGGTDAFLSFQATNMWAGIGLNTLPAILGGTTALGRFENKVSNYGGTNYGIIIDIENATYNQALYVKGNSYFDGGMASLRSICDINFDSSSAYQSDGIILTYKRYSSYFVTNTTGSRNLLLPSYGYDSGVLANEDIEIDIVMSHVNTYTTYLCTRGSSCFFKDNNGSLLGPTDFPMAACDSVRLMYKNQVWYIVSHES